jgi:sigma-E factor negative regulatory protein RseA
MDGEVDGSEAPVIIDRVIKEQDARAHWDTYHLISDAFRNDYLLSRDVVAKVGCRLAEEPTVLAPRARSNFVTRVKRHVLSAAASVAAVAVVGWLAFAYNPLTSETAPRNVASVVPPAAVGSSGSATMQPVALDGNVRAYLFAHQEYSPTTQIQGVAPYVRTVSEVPANESR